MVIRKFSQIQTADYILAHKVKGRHGEKCEVSEELKILCRKIKNRKTSNFLTFSSNSLILDLEITNIY